jgi:RimJ/RimL family protein N-acetyltransferase
MISFPQKQVSVRNALTGEEYLLVALDSIDPSEEAIERVTSICNEPLVYDWLFRKMLSGEPYPPSKAKEWFEWAAMGWAQNAFFVFGVLDPDGRLAAACDIKTADAAGAEVGYWASCGHRGIMTNALKGLIDLAKGAGFESLFAEVREDNVRSQAVLRRAGFCLSDQKPARAGHRMVFSVRMLTP